MVQQESRAATSTPATATGRGDAAAPVRPGRAADLTRWMRSLYRQLRRAARPEWYGTIRIEVSNGFIKRILIERSFKAPEEDEEDLARSDGGA